MNAVPPDIDAASTTAVVTASATVVEVVGSDIATVYVDIPDDGGVFIVGSTNGGGGGLPLLDFFKTSFWVETSADMVT